MKKILLLLCTLLMSASSFMFAQTTVNDVILADLTGAELAPYSPRATQMGWNPSSGMSAMFAVKYLVLETEGGSVGQGTPGAFDNLILWWQGGGGQCLHVPWTSKELTWWGNSIAYPNGRGIGKTVSIAIDLQAAMGTGWADFINLVSWSNIGLVGANWGSGNLSGDTIGRKGNPIDELGLKKVYLTTDFTKPAGAVNYDSYGFIWDGAVTGTAVAPPMPSPFDLLPTFGGAGKNDVFPYDCGTKTLTFTETGGGGRGWWFSNTPGSGKNFSMSNEVVVTFDPSGLPTSTVQLVIEYNDGTKNLTTVPAGAASVTTLLLDGKSNDVKQIYIQSMGANPPDELTLFSAVVDMGATRVTGVSLDQTQKLGMLIGDNLQLTATVAPANATDQNVTWSSSDPAVATVDASGLVTAVGGGTATITVTTEDGNKTATCKVTVKSNDATLATLTVNQGTLNPAFNPAVTAYTVGVANDITSIVLGATATSTAATVSGDTGTQALNEGDNVFTITVTAEDGTVKDYTVTVTRGLVLVTGVSLNKTSTVLTVGDIEQLIATVSPFNAANQNVSWSSSDPTIVLVEDGGYITALSAGGPVTITVTTEDGGFQATCDVTVNPASTNVAVTGVSLNKPAVTLLVGATTQLAATVAPSNATNKNVSWSSSDETVATVDATGLVTAVGEGTATITVTTVDGGYAADCAVTVTSTAVPATGVSLDLTTLALKVDGTQQLTATISPAGATNPNLTWISSDPAVATVDASGLVTAVGAGTATITVTTVDGGFTASCKVTVSPKSGIPALDAGTSAYISSGQLVVQSPVVETIRVYSAVGVLLNNFQKPAGKVSYPINQAKGAMLIVKGSSGWVKKLIEN